MLRRFPLGRASTLENCLSNPNLKLEDLYEADDQLLQEVHLQNPKLISFLRRPPVLLQLVNAIVRDIPEKSKNEAAFQASRYACEILSAGIPALMDGMVYANPEILVVLWALLDQPRSLSPQQLVGFCRINDMLLRRRTGDLISFLQEHPELLSKWIDHIFIEGGAGMPYLTDLMVALVRCDYMSEGAGVAAWLIDQDLPRLLIARLDPNEEPENHEVAQLLLCAILRADEYSRTNAIVDYLLSYDANKQLADYMLDKKALHAASAFIHGASLIRGVRQQFERSVVSDGTKNDTTLFDFVLTAFTERVDDILSLLEGPRSVQDTTKTLGLERITVCELMVDLLYCSSAVMNYRQRHSTASQSCPGHAFRAALIQHQAIPRCIKPFFEFPWNNIYHNSAYAFLREIIVEDATRYPELLDEILFNATLVRQILERAQETKKTNQRVGYLGHLTLLSNDLKYLFKGFPALAQRVLDESNLRAQWDAHISELDKDVQLQMAFGGDAVYWNASQEYHNDMDEDVHELDEGPMEGEAEARDAEWTK
ncbi:SIT4 phosphatase-associated protein-domain-containing protein [Syncephalastrum racemosum]|uniref:SIT4 phosphatase-associated protein-domain-containing protein n=1 Tax=Syncephalastrum racemosum TaxID=13706 RepID=A0A1X2H4P0_SYNRA|nr:SIT4 phosphatase-associated protein-domain-containing protein [Syncephalastrum racemosum]